MLKLKVPTSLINTAYFSILILLFIRLLGSFIDPDLWWHIRLGESILNNNWVNNLTFTCTDYVWVNHAWLSDVLIGQLHNIFGFQGMSVFFAFVFAGGIFFNFLTIKEIFKKLNIHFSRLAILLYLVLFIQILTSFIAIRPQAFSFLFINALLFFLIKVSQTKSSNYKTLLYLTPLFLLWVNLHGGFPIGIILIVVFIGFNIIELVQSTLFNKGKDHTLVILKRSLFLLAMLGCFVLASLVNPFGLDLWKEIFTLVLGNSNANFIMEWKAINIKDTYFLFYFIIVAGTFVLQILNRNYNLLRLLLLAAFGFLSFYSVRYILPVSGIVMMIFIIELVQFGNSFRHLFNDKELIKPLKYLKFLCWTMFGIIALLLAVTSAKFFNNLSNLDDSQNPTLLAYPVKSKKLIENNVEKFKDINFYNTYVWGGYLSYTLPDNNWFINGIMPEWACSGKLRNTIMLDYMELEQLGVKWTEIIEKYNIGALLIQNNSTLANVIAQSDDWQVLYQDELAVLYFKIK